MPAERIALAAHRRAAAFSQRQAWARLSRAAWFGLGGSGSRLRGCGGLAFFATLRSAQS